MAFIISEVLEDIADDMYVRNKAGPAALLNLLGALQDAASELISPSGSDQSLDKAAKLASVGIAWIEGAD